MTTPEKRAQLELELKSITEDMVESQNEERRTLARAYLTMQYSFDAYLAVVPEILQINFMTYMRLKDNDLG